ncbi:uncharacterized protein JCM6883_004982 [Sporobolomyces salmoneus]|uniref:uncharacterized protein n=1 Tax=Sporobolomyces salmoneus TaxID=183962 RepID=UPI00316EC53F
MAIDSNARRVDAVIRLCFYQGTSAVTWTGLVKQLAGDGVDMEKDTTESLLSLLSESETPPPTLFSFLHESLQGPLPLVRSEYLVKSLLSSISSSLPLPTLEAIFSLVNAAQQQQASATTPYLSSSTEETAQGLIGFLDNLLSRFVSSASTSATYPAIIDWSNSFLTTQTRTLTSKTLQTSPSLPTCQSKIEQFLDSLPSPSSTSESQPGQLVALVGPLNSVLSRLSSNGNKRRKIPRLSNRAGGPDLDLFVSSLYSTTPRTIQPDFARRLIAILEYRQRQAVFYSASKEEATIETFSQLFDAAVRAYESERTMRSEHVKRSILGVKLPKLIRKVVNGDEQLKSGVSEALREKTRSSQAMEIDNDNRSTAMQILVAGLCREELISEEITLSIDRTIDKTQLQSSSIASFDLQSRLTSDDAEEVKQTLSLLSTDLSIQAELSNSICELIASHAQSTDPDALAHFCDALIQDPQTLEVVFVHEEPRRFLGPIRETLDSLDTAQDNFGESNLIERYGNLVVVVEIVVHRFELVDNLSHHLGSSQSFLSSWIPTSSAAYSLQSLDEEGRTAVAGFISALFGDGISDDLMHATNPRTLLKVAPTILKQSLVACQNGVVDLDSLKDALSYFLQELLSFTLPGVLQWLIGEIERTPPSPAQNAMFDILQVILFAESLPKTVLELVSTDLARLLSSNASFSLASPPPLDVNRAKRLVVGLLKRPRQITAAASSTSTSWSDQLKEHLPLLARSGPEQDTTLEAFLIRQALARLEFAPEKLSSTIISTLLSMTPALPNVTPRRLSEEEERDYMLWSQIERVGSSIFSESPSMLYPLLNNVVPSLLSSPTITLRPKTAMERNKIEMLGDIVGGACTVALSQADDEGNKSAVTQLDRLAEDLRIVLKRKAVNGVAEEEEEEDSDDPKLKTVFVARLTSYDSLSAASSTFSSLSSSLS